MYAALHGRRFRHALESPDYILVVQPTVESLEKLAVEQDYAIIILSPDDRLQFRGKRVLGPDNPLLEARLFVKLVYRKGVFVCARDSDVKSPMNPNGVTVTCHEEPSGQLRIARPVRDILLAIADHAQSEAEGTLISI